MPDSCVVGEYRYIWASGGLDGPQYAWAPHYGRRVQEGRTQVQVSFCGSLIWINVEPCDLRDLD